MSQMGRLPPVSGCLYGISLLGLGLTSILPFIARESPHTGIGAYGEVRPIPAIRQKTMKG